MLIPDNIHFQKLQITDLALMHHWLNTPFVMEWWEKQPTSFEDVREEYQAYIEGRDPARPYLIIYDSTPIGYIQTYNFKDEPQWCQAVQPPDEAAGVDIFIGHPDYIHRGLGSFILRKFMQEIVFSQAEIESCIIDPEPANKTALRAYEKAGFRYWKTIYGGEDGSSDAENYCMRITKVEFLASLTK